MNEHNQKHLTLSDRTYIEQELLQKNTFTSIGRNLHKDPTTIAKEVGWFDAYLLSHVSKHF